MRWYVLMLSLLILSGCTKVKTDQPPSVVEAPPANEQPTEPVDNQPGAPEGLYPEDTRTSIPEIDHLIQAVTSKSKDDLYELIRFSKVPCTSQKSGMPGLPSCQDGEPDGTLVEVFPAHACKIRYLSSLDLVQADLDRIMERPLFLYAVFSSTRDDGGGLTTRRATFAETVTDEKAVTFYIDETGALVGLNVGCGTAASVVDYDFLEFILPPK